MRRFTSSLTVIAVQSTTASDALGKRCKLTGCALITHRLAPNGRLSLLLETTTGDMVPNEAAKLDWIEKRLPQMTTIAGYQLPETMTLLKSCSDPKRHPLTAQLVAGSGPDCIDLTEANLFKRPRSLAAACRRASVQTLPRESRLVRSFAPWIQRMMHDDLVNACAATWRLWVANHVDASELTPSINVVVADMDAWLAACCVQDKNRTLGGYMMRLFE